MLYSQQQKQHVCEHTVVFTPEHFAVQSLKLQNTQGENKSIFLYGHGLHLLSKMPEAKRRKLEKVLELLL